VLDWSSLRFGVNIALTRFARWLYRGQRPNGLARLVNRVAAAVFARGVAPNYLVTLDVTGRRSGRTISLPLVMAVLDRQRYLVSHLGSDVAWVRNVKATAGRAVLRHGRIEHVRLEEFAIDKRAPVLKAHLRHAPGARPHIPVDKDAPLEEFDAVAAQFPVFRVLAAG
jgi:F420H(2)-dependent quinone reductase